MSIDKAEIRKEYKALFENPLDLIYVHDLMGNFIDANDIALETLGYKREEIPNLSFKNLIEKEQLEQAINIIKELKEKGKQSKRTEYRLKTKNGNFIYVETYGIPLKKKGKIYGILGIANNITERKKAENKLKESESKFRTITEQLLMGIIILQDNVLKYVNEAVAKIGENTPQEIIGWSMNDFTKLIHPDDLPFIIEQAKKKQAGETDVPTHYSCRIFTKSGKLKWVDVYSKSILYQGKPADFITLIDITDKKKAEQALKESEKRLKELNIELEQIVDERTQNLKQSEEKYRLISENANDLFIIINENFDIEYMNEQITQKLLGYKKEELIGRYSIDLLHHDDIEHTIKSLRMGFKTGEGTVIIRVKHKKGYWIWLEVKGSVFIDNNGNKKGLLIARDITERKNIEEKLRKSEEMFRAVFETAKDCIFIKNRSLQYIQVNPAMEEMFGVPAEELKNKTDIDLFGKETGKHVIEVDRSVINGEIIEEELTKPIHGIPHTFHTIKVPLKDANGNIFGLCGIARDISERKQAEQKLKESEKKFKALYKGIPIPTYTWQKENDDLVLIDYNVASEQITDGKIKNYLGIKASELYSDQPTILKELYQCFEEKLNFSRELYYYYKSTNKTKYLFVNYAFVPPDLVLVHTEDITEKKRAEQQLKESEEKYRHLFENSPFSILLTDTKGNIMECNSTIEKLYGIKKEEMVGKNYKEILPVFKVSELETFFEDRNKRILEGINPPPIEIPCYIKDDSLVWMNLHSSLVNLGSKKYIQIILQDITERKVAEKELKKLNRELEYKVIERTKELEKSEKKFRQIFESIPDLFFLVDKNTVIIDYRGKREAFYAPPEEFLNKRMNEILPPNQRKMITEMVSKTIITKKPQIKEYSLLIKGQIRDYEGRFLYFSKSRVAIFIRDISERKKAEQQIKESEEKFRRICESIPDLFFLVSEDSTILDYRGKSKHLYAHPKEFMGRRIVDVVPPDLGQKILVKIRDTIATKKPQILEYLLTIRGKDHYYEARHLFFSKEQVAVFIRDISERKIAEKELKESEEKYRTLFDEAPIGILTCDVNGNILNVNTSALKLLGSPSKEATEEINLLTFPLLMKAGISADFKKCIMENRKISSERPYISKWGKSVFFRSKLVPTLDQEGKIIKVLGTFDDISNLKLAEQKLRKSEEKLRKQNIELRRLDELKNDFITIAAHELKTPMVSITGYTDYILTHNKDLDFEIRKDLLLIQKNSQRLNLLIEKLLDVMKIDAKKMDIIREEKNIYDIIENCVEELSFQINDKKLNVIVDVQKDLYLKVDPNRIYEVFSNLFSNAVKFTLNGGNIEISAKKIKNQFLFKVRNEGKGLNIYDIRKLFKKFEVIEKESADHINRKKGLGLGLYISKGVVEAHGGKIWGTSKGKDKGAEFYFTLPIIEA